MSSGFIVDPGLDDEGYTPQTVRARKVAERDKISETTRTSRVLRWLNSLPRTYAWKLHTGPLGEGGHPDIDCCSNGRAVKIEMKDAGKKPTARQFERLRGWQRVGALVGWAESVEHVQQILAHRDDPIPWLNPLTGPGDPTARNEAIR